MNTVLEAAVADFFEHSAMNGLELRTGQVIMAQETAAAIAAKHSLAVEAEVGTGKSYAYLVPASIQYQREHRQIVIATSTIALQEQLYRDTITVMRMLGMNAEVLLAKGMKHFVCMRKLRAQRRKHPEHLILTQTARFCADGKQDISQMPFHIPELEWKRICISHFGATLCQSCDLKSVCSYAQMRSRLRHGNDIVICNHNMLVSHLRNQQDGNGIFNQNRNILIVDEAHHLEHTFRESFTEAYSRKEMIRLLKRNLNSSRYRQKLVAHAIHDVSLFFQQCRDQIRSQQEQSEDDMSTFYFENTPDTKNLLGKIKHILPELQIEHELSGLYEFLRKVYHSDKRSIIWLENKPELRLCVCQKDIRADIRAMLYRSGHSTILTAATLAGSVEGTPREQYAYFLDSIGFPDTGIVSEPKKSPFDYDRNTMLYCSKHLPYPKHDDMENYRERSISEIVDLLRITDGKALILFTAKADMLYVYKKLSNMDLPYRILMQSKGSSQEHQLDKFRKDTNSVILGTGIFWEGISIEGESLSQVIIFKLPFPAPDPILDWKMSLCDHPIQEVAVPEMLIRLRQGVGRLIRSETDCGIVSILDPRAVGNYSQIICSVLPMKHMTGSIAEIAEFWERIRSEKE